MSHQIIENKDRKFEIVTPTDNRRNLRLSDDCSKCRYCLIEHISKLGQRYNVFICKLDDGMVFGGRVCDKFEYSEEVYGSTLQM